MRVEIAHITSFQSRTAMSSSTTMTNFVYMNCRRNDQTHHHPLGVAGIGLADRDDRDAVGAALGRQPEIDDLGELLLKERDEHLVQRFAEH